MTPSISKEVSDALHATESGHSLEVTDPTNNRTYFIINDEMYRRAMEALHQQEDLEAIQEGIDQAERGETMPIAEADALMRKELGFPER